MLIEQASGQHSAGIAPYFDAQSNPTTLPGLSSGRLSDLSLPSSRLRLSGRQSHALTGGAKNDILRGRAGDDLLRGQSGDDKLYGAAGNDLLNGGRGRNSLYGGAGQDQLLGGKDADILVGGAGDDILNGKGGADRSQGGAGRDRFVLATGAAELRKSLEIADFKKGEDYLELPTLKFADLMIQQGTGAAANSTVIQNRLTGEYLAIVQGVSSLDASDFWGYIAPPTLPAAVGAVQPSTVKFASSGSEATIAATAAARIQLGSQTIYIGTEQVSSLNQNPVIVSFDAQNPANNWRRTDYEMTGTDGRGYGLYWSGSQLYGIFSVDGTQGSPDQDFRRVSGGATQSWLRSYGSGGGAKVAVLARLNPATGEMTDAVYLSALNGSKSNSLALDSISSSASGNLVINAQSYFAPRRPDGQAMTQTTAGGSPFGYTLEITPDLKTVVSTAAVGWI